MDTILKYFPNLSPLQIDQLSQLGDLYADWNSKINVVSRKDIENIYPHHILHSMGLAKVFQFKPGSKVMDLGTGGGLPGIPLAIFFPEIDIVLLDSNGKKTRFLFQVKTQLALKNVIIENTRVKSYYPSILFDIVVSRAFASLHDMVINTKHLLQPEGRLWAMKGVYPENELRDCEKHAIVDAFYPLAIPNIDGERHLLILKPIP